ncbi:urea ABC transporter, ATP-binding protein UrtE [Citreicella sp. SE45]|uniref:Amino acid/amide ABC transporter ATP-binding protein 2, HAAT family n=1 Tax=Salipiger thiooxidans TaxID=282683 RepID=A0A1G7MIU8_9RHOB|nr:urea ABC transporter ATP-binding subunit UrtE [Salipiger thiooxidans]EEX16974.1 urea ABC transporter, ATP-binding protein UrtE [Citreicella sp. SE45]SDF61079.1 amino acid/amide ABC transporter ATP-binding protein 2, HAAT family [Salipiger thiooxidans]
MLSLANVDSFYGRSQALHAMTISAPRGAVLGILGRNGVGKTTLLRTILGLTDRSEGVIALGGTPIEAFPTHERARAGIAYVPQGRMIIPDFTIRENILMGGFAATGARRIPDIVPELFPYLMDNLDRPGGVLSGGQQQQLAIARALACKPKVLLMDEPTEGIQPNIVAQIEDIIIRLNTELGLTILLVEQNVAFVRRAAKAFAMIEHGTAVESGPIDTLTDAMVHKHMAI